MTPRTLSPDVRDLDAVDRVRLALLLLGPVAHATETAAVEADLAYWACRSEAGEAGAPADWCRDRHADRQATNHQRHRLTTARHALEGWLQAAGETQEGVEAA